MTKCGSPGCDITAATPEIPWCYAHMLSAYKQQAALMQTLRRRLQRTVALTELNDEPAKLLGAIALVASGDDDQEHIR